MASPRSFLAPNPGPFTGSGTRTFLVGDRSVAVVDPGPALPSHLAALYEALSSAESCVVLLTHDHPDHSAAALPLAERFGCEVLGPGTSSDRSLEPGEVVETDAGELVTVPTPGHTRDHLSFHWPTVEGLFAGDTVLGEGDTTWVAGYPGCVADYLRSIEHLRGLDLSVIYPAHGPDILDVPEALDRFEGHRRLRIKQVEEALRSSPDATPEMLVSTLYGPELPSRMVDAAVESVVAVLDFLGTRAGAVTGNVAVGRTAMICSLTRFRRPAFR